jgi:hypothetical protein
MALFWKRNTQRRKSTKYWEWHQRRWERSGLTQAEYCRKEGIALTSFSNWRSKLMSSMAQCSEFIEIQPAVIQAGPEMTLELIIPRVGCLRMPATIGPEALRVIILAIRGIEAC